MSGLVLRPVYDRWAVPAIARLYLPLSRAWAAGLAAEGDTDCLHTLLPGLALGSRGAERALRRLGTRADCYARASARWEQALFGPEAPDPDDLAGIESRRAETAQALMLGRLAFLRAHLQGSEFAPVQWDIAGPDEVSRRHGHRLGGPSAPFPVPGALPALEVSRSVPGDGFRTQWLRGATNVGGSPDTLWARVERPPGDGPHPALIFSHGICMETEFFHEIGSPAQRLAASGIAVIRPEGPYHGRRRIAGCYGGEPVLARGPLGLLDYFETHVRELAQLTAWARRNLGGPVAVGGVSLGALTAQLTAGAARHWPPEMRPDAVFLVTASASMLAVALEGSLPRALGTAQLLAAHGWDREILSQWLPLLEPDGDPAVPGNRIVVVLGRRDDITPYAEGERLVRRWRVPRENVFLRDLGHFTTALDLYRDMSPFERVGAILAAA